MRVLLCVLMALACAFAQPTKLGFEQVKPPSIASSGNCVVIYYNNGGTCALLDPSVTLVLINGVPTIKAMIPVMLSGPVVNEAYTATAGQAAFPLANVPLGGQVLAYWNGLRQRPGADFTVAGNVVSFTLGLLVQAGDVMLFDYAH